MGAEDVGMVAPTVMVHLMMKRTTMVTMAMKDLMVVKVEMVNLADRAIKIVVDREEEVKEKEIIREEGAEANTVETMMKSQSPSIVEQAKEGEATTVSSMDLKILKAPSVTSRPWIT